MADKTSGYRALGLQSILMGDTLVGTTAHYITTTMDTLGNFVPDSAHLIIDADVVNDFYVEDKAELDCQIRTPGKKSIEFATRDMGATMMAALLGGNASNPTCFLAPITAIVVNEKSFEIMTQAIGGYRFKIQIPRASLTIGGGDLRFAKSETGTLTITAAIMLPTHSAVAPFKMIAQP